MTSPQTRRDVLRGAAASALVAGAAATTTPSATASTTHRHGRPEELRVLAINIWLGGKVIEPGPALVADVLLKTAADIVLLSESGETTAWLATELGRRTGRRWYHADSDDTGILSRYPIIGSAVLPWTTKAVVDVCGRQVAAYASHLEYRWYATYLPRGYAAGVPTGPYAGWDKLPTGPVLDVAEILRVNAASGRPEVMRTVLADAAREQAHGRAVILGGDYNEPSWLDWTARTADLMDHHGLVVPWQTTKLIAEAGYVDAYRSTWTDARRYLGATWPASNESARVDQLTWAPEADERDRIDFIFASRTPGLKLLGAGIVGPQGSIVRNERVDERTTADFVSHPEPWPTDHKAVMATYRLAGHPHH